MEASVGYRDDSIHQIPSKESHRGVKCVKTASPLAKGGAFTPAVQAYGKYILKNRFLTSQCGLFSDDWR